MNGKLIVIEGTDCSGKETQSKLLEKNLNEIGIDTKVVSFPFYDSPTGRIIGACYLGKQEMCDKYLKNEVGWFKEGASNVDPMVASLYYVADRKYNIDVINKMLDDGISVILDRYVYSNMAHQACKKVDESESRDIIKKLDMLEFEILNLPKPDIVFLLYVPYMVAQKLKENRAESGDQHENDVDYLRRAETTYLLLKDMYDFKLVECSNNGIMKKREDISQEVLDSTLNLLEKKDKRKCLEK